MWKKLYPKQSVECVAMKLPKIMIGKLNTIAQSRADLQEVKRGEKNYNDKKMSRL